MLSKGVAATVVFPAVAAAGAPAPFLNAKLDLEVVDAT